jgi:hypothetical protein
MIVDAEFAEKVLGFRPGDIAGLDGRDEEPAARRGPGPEWDGDEGEFPGPGDEYQPHARVSNKEVPMIAFIMRQKPAFMAFSYANLDTLVLEAAAGPGSALVVAVRFTGMVNREVRIEGRNLLPLVRYLQQHRIHWVRQIPTDRDFRNRKATVLTRITVTEVKA